MASTGSKESFEGEGGGISERSRLGRRLDPDEFALTLKAAGKLFLAELCCEIKALVRARHKSVCQVEKGPKQS